MKRGERIASVAKPIAKTVDRILGTHIQGCEGCNQMEKDLDAGMGFTRATLKRFSRTRGDRPDPRKIKHVILVDQNPD